MKSIPQIIYQVWSEKYKPLPRHLTLLAETWERDYPDWEYVLWYEEKMWSFVKEYYPQYLEFYTHLPYDIQRWEVIRYLFLYKQGRHVH